MEIIEVEIDKIHPDQNQPRHANEEEKEGLEEMARSILTAGVINPIEVDKNLVIITGERRWKAAKLAGLKTVPVRILDISDDDRFIRQAIENIHQEKMSPLDIANMLDRIRKKILISAAEVKKGSGGYRHGQPGIRELHKLIGLPESTISEHLALLGETGEMREALKDPNFSRTKVPIIKEAPGKYRRKLRSLVAKQKDLPRETVKQLTKALRRAERYGEDYAASRLVRQSYEGLSSVDALNRINKIVPDEESRIKEPADALKLISEKVIELMEMLDKHPLASFDNFHRPLIVGDLKRFESYLQNYFQEKSRILEGKLTEEIKLLGKNNGK